MAHVNVLATLGLKQDFLAKSGNFEILLFLREVHFLLKIIINGQFKKKIHFHG